MDKKINKETNNEEKTKVYSYHTFIFPFLWNDGGKVNRKKFEKCLNKKWKLDIFGEFCAGEFRVEDSNKKRQRYAAYQYFNDAAKSAIYTMDKGENQVVRNFRFAPELFIGNTKTVMYHIKKDESEYVLRVSGIRLKLYDSGVGLLVFELENYKYESVSDINKINEYGRRICRPYYYKNTDKPGYGCSLTADFISIIGPEINVSSEIGTANPLNDPQRTELAEFVTWFLQNDKYQVTINKSEANHKKFFIEPIIDDRMYVCCYMINKGFADSLVEYNGTEYKYIYDAAEKPPESPDNVSGILYEFVFVDGNGMTCPSRTMLQKAMKEHIYDRWIENSYQGNLCGSVYGITEYSCMCATASDADFLAEAFLTEYVEIAMLVLAQRASLLAFERNISKVSKLKKNEDKLQRTYVDFDSKYMLVEVTEQQQGIEMYNMLLDKAFVKNQKKDVEEQIKSLFELKNHRNNKWQNWILFPISVFGLWGIFEEIIELGGWEKLYDFRLLPVVFAIIVIIGCYILKKRVK